GPMLTFLLRRTAHAALAIAVAVTATFALIHLAPGDPLTATIEDPRVPESVRAHWRHAYGLDESLPRQYARFVAGALRGDLGYSIAHEEPVRTVVARALGNTLALMTGALLLSFLAGMALGVIQVARHGTALDRGIGWITLVLYSVPEFWLAQIAL